VNGILNSFLVIIEVNPLFHTEYLVYEEVYHDYRRSQGGAKEPCPPKFLENIVILCFERRFSKQNSVIRIKSNILAPKKCFGSPQIFGLAVPLIMINFIKSFDKIQKYRTSY